MYMGFFFLPLQQKFIVYVFLAGSQALRQLMEVVVEAKKLEAENAHQWRMTKLLLKFIKNQEREITKTEK